MGFNLKDIYLKDLKYLKEEKADYDYDREDGETAFGDDLPVGAEQGFVDDDTPELKPGEIDSMNLSLKQHDIEVRQLLNQDTGYIDLPKTIATIKDKKVADAIGPLLNNWNESAKKITDKPTLEKVNGEILKLKEAVVEQSWFYRHNKDAKSKKYIFQTKEFEENINKIHNEAQEVIKGIKGSANLKNEILIAYDEFYKGMIKLKKDQSFAVRIKEIIQKEIRTLYEKK